MKSYSEVVMHIISSKKAEEHQAYIAALEWVLGMHDPAPAPEPDYGDQLKLIGTADELEANVLDLIVHTLGEIENEDHKFQDALNESVRNLMDEIADLGEKYFGIPEMHTYPYTLLENEPVVLFNLSETKEWNEPVWWHDDPEGFTGWGCELEGVPVLLAKTYQANLSAGLLPIGTTCAVPLRDAEAMMKHYQEVN